MDTFIGQIVMGGWNFAPRGFANCDGQLLAIAQNTALFSLLGTNFGGDGMTTFALPDLRGRTMLGTGNGPGLSTASIGERAGTPTTTLSVTNLASHAHTVSIPVSSDDASTSQASGKYLATSDANIYAASPTGGESLGGVAVANAGGSVPFDNMQPYLTIRYCIALQGIFPSRN
jgi:microcystin-dependent protein